MSRALSFAAALCAALVLAACGGGGGSSTPQAAPAPVPPASVANTMPVVVDNGPATGNGSFNVPFVSVTICKPGTTTCQTVDHVMVDTGSYGLRLISPVDPALGLAAATAGSGKAIGECAQFVSGYTWGTVVKADIKLAGEVAASQSVQLVGVPPGGVSATPADCTAVGSNIGTVTALGANGILGVGLLKHDCGPACANSVISATYYACGAVACSGTTMPLSQQVSNPVASFASDNNGVVLALQAVPSGGVTSLSGTLTFGINTQDNNRIVHETKFAADGSGYFTTQYNSVNMTESFIDSGSNALYFDDATLAKCSVSTDFYCPATSQFISASIESYNGNSGGLTLLVDNVDKLGGGVVAASIAGPYSTQHADANKSFDWGLPFFFGRRVFVGFEGGADGPYWAY